MPPISGSQSVLPPPRTAQLYSSVNPSGHSQYIPSAQQSISVQNTQPTEFTSQLSQEIQHRSMISTSQISPLVKKSESSSSSTSADPVKSDHVQANQNSQWALNSPPSNIPQNTVSGMSSSIDKTSQVSVAQTVASQTLFTRVSKTSAHDQSHSIPLSHTSNISPSNIAPNRNSHVQQNLATFSEESTRTQTVQTQSAIGSSESSSQFKYGDPQNVFSTSSMTSLGAQNIFNTSSMMSSGAQNVFSTTSIANPSAQNLFSISQAHNTGLRNPQDYSSLSQPQQNLLTGYAGQNVHQNLPGQRNYPQQDTTAIPGPPRTIVPPSTANQLHSVKSPLLGMPPPSGHQMVMKLENNILTVLEVRNNRNDKYPKRRIDNNSIRLASFHTTVLAIMSVLHLFF